MRRIAKPRALGTPIKNALDRYKWEIYSGDNPELRDAWIGGNLVGFFYHSSSMKRMYHVELWQASTGKHTGFIHEDTLEEIIKTKQVIKLEKVKTNDI